MLYESVDEREVKDELFAKAWRWMQRCIVLEKAEILAKGAAASLGPSALISTHHDPFPQPPSGLTFLRSVLHLPLSFFYSLESGRKTSPSQAQFPLTESLLTSAQLTSCKAINPIINLDISTAQLKNSY